MIFVWFNIRTVSLFKIMNNLHRLLRGPIVKEKLFHKKLWENFNFFSLYKVH